jgi:uncharacterized protein with GYD domain
MKEFTMPQYLIQVSYTSAAWAALAKHPHDRFSVTSKAVESLGGKMLYGWMSFGDYDTVAVIEMPDNVGAASVAIAFSAGGACKSFKTTPLISHEDSVTAARLAGGVTYQPPS